MWAVLYRWRFITFWKRASFQAKVVSMKRCTSHAIGWKALNQLVPEDILRNALVAKLAAENYKNKKLFFQHDKLAIDKTWGKCYNENNSQEENFLKRFCYLRNMTKEVKE